MRWFLTVIAAAGLAMAGVSSADAGSRGYSQGEGAHPASPYYRKGPQVRGYTERRGGYSYNKGDTINTYGDSTGRYGSTDAYRDYDVDNQTVAGPFDKGFFFDSGTGMNGGDAPYQN